MKDKELNKRDVKKWQKKQRKLGNCRVCGLPAINLRHCKYHRDKENAYARERYAFKKSKELIPH